MHIGLIGGIGSAATIFYYKNLVAAFANMNRRLDLTIVQADVLELVKNVNADEPLTQAGEYIRLTNQLKATGADFVVVTSLGGHFCIAEFEALSPLPVLNAIPILADDLRRRGINRVGILGTRVVMKSGLYGACSDQEIFLPEGSVLDTAHEIYQSLGITGKITATDRQTLFDIGQTLIARGAEVVLLAGTDLYVAFENYDCGFAVLDCAEIHIAAVAQASLSGSLPGV